MATIMNLVSPLELNSLITVLDIQVALAVVIISFLTKDIVARIIIGIVYKLTKNTNKARDSRMYKPLKQMFVFVAVYIALRIIPKGEFHAAFINEIFEVIIILFVTKLITTLIYSDSKILKKFLKKDENYKVNDLVCKILRGFTWLVSILVIISELDLIDNFTGLLTGLGFASAIIALAAQELVKNLLSRSINLNR